MRNLTLMTLGLLTLAACNTLPDPVAEPVFVDVPPMRTCTPINALTRVTIPAKTETYYAITEIENPPYEPIQNKQTMTRVIEEARTVFVNSEGTEVTDVCDVEINPNGMTSDGSF
ncbi:hypothetical protein GCM10009069_01920 [Algimonas arctica]|uniref:Lipoprotein n=1 Tax=Algimonas arctica TaxID=1479486 RepID=A0A8J3G126_9PROT|nr:hypothetical protein [Algimonas arctica]GHA82391.1 hypothetical protein GCM10009069_01920 [Algimonas arctica]